MNLKAASQKLDLSFYKFKLGIQIRFRDTDAMGHVNNAVFLSYLELARVKYWEMIMSTGDYASMKFILVRVEIDYRSPVKLGDDIWVHVRTSRLGRSSWEFDYKLVDQRDGRLVAEAKTVQCCYDYKKNKVERMSEEFKSKLRKYEGLNA